MVAVPGMTRVIRVIRMPCVFRVIVTRVIVTRVIVFRVNLIVVVVFTHSFSICNGAISAP